HGLFERSDTKNTFADGGRWRAYADIFATWYSLCIRLPRGRLVANGAAEIHANRPAPIFQCFFSRFWRSRKSERFDGRVCERWPHSHARRQPDLSRHPFPP